jgi:hypothetical protein
VIDYVYLTKNDVWDVEDRGRRSGRPTLVATTYGDLSFEKVKNWVGFHDANVDCSFR